MPASPHSAIGAELEALRPALLRFALLQLRNEAVAEDAVQETLIAVLEKPDHFDARSSLRTYATAILKYKIIDALRSATRERAVERIDDEASDELMDTLFAADGHALAVPRDWGDPDRTLEQQDFFRVLETCLERLPEKTARVFLMREWLELDTEEICKELGISASNAWVILYRARLRLRECLDLYWFGNG
jgi:RNA polymerase sigma-70 factor (ECF subfamily)